MNESVKSVPLIAHTINFFSNHLVAVGLLVKTIFIHRINLFDFWNLLHENVEFFLKLLYQKLLYSCEWLNKNETDNILYVAMILNPSEFWDWNKVEFKIFNSMF